MRPEGPRTAPLRGPVWGGHPRGRTGSDQGYRLGRERPGDDPPPWTSERSTHEGAPEVLHPPAGRYACSRSETPFILAVPESVIAGTRSGRRTPRGIDSPARRPPHPGCGESHTTPPSSPGPSELPLRPDRRGGMLCRRSCTSRPASPDRVHARPRTGDGAGSARTSCPFEAGEAGDDRDRLMAKGPSPSPSSLKEPHMPTTRRPIESVALPVIGPPLRGHRHGVAAPRGRARRRGRPRNGPTSSSSSATTAASTASAAMARTGSKA